MSIIYPHPPAPPHRPTRHHPHPPHHPHHPHHPYGAEAETLEDHIVESTRLEAVTTCVGFDDFLDASLTRNHGQLDTMIVVTSHEDTRTQAVARKHNCLVVPTDLFRKNGRNFNKGAAINIGMAYFQYHGWRMHVDADIVLPTDFRRVLFNHTALDCNCLYGADRINVMGMDGLAKTVDQHTYGYLISPPPGGGEIGARLVNKLHGYQPIGYFQMWHCSKQKPYPYGLGTAENDDVLFASLWPEPDRRLLPSAIVYHLVSKNPSWGENWEGRTVPRLK